MVSLKTTVPVKKDEELFEDYGYDLDNSPKWYRELHRKTQKKTSQKRKDHAGKYNLVLNTIPLK